MVKKIKIGKIEINFSNRWLYTFIAMGVLAIISVGVYAFASSTTGVGHSRNEIEPCGDGQILQTSGTSWSCVDMPAGVTDTSCTVSGDTITCPDTTSLTDTDTHGSLSCIIQQCWNGKGDSNCFCTTNWCVTYCPDGYTATGGGFQEGLGGYSMPYPIVSWNAWFCAYTDYCYARCCKVV